MNAAQEVPPNSSTAIGNGTATVSGSQVTYNISYSGLTLAPTGAHVHGPALPGANAPVVHPFTVTGLGTSGSFSATFTYTAAELADLQSGKEYANIHTANFPGGEIRGQILPVPEPATLALFGLGASALLWRISRKRG